MVIQENYCLPLASDQCGKPGRESKTSGLSLRKQDASILMHLLLCSLLCERVQLSDMPGYPGVQLEIGVNGKAAGGAADPMPDSNAKCVIWGCIE